MKIIMIKYFFNVQLAVMTNIKFGDIKMYDILHSRESDYRYCFVSHIQYKMWGCKLNKKKFMNNFID